MTRKTRKEKIIANLRRELKRTRLRRDLDRQAKIDTQAPALKSTIRSKTSSKINSSVNLSTFIKQDLKRTFALSLLAISLEFMLYSTLN